VPAATAKELPRLGLADAPELTLVIAPKSRAGIRGGCSPPAAAL